MLGDGEFVEYELSEIVVVVEGEVLVGDVFVGFCEVYCDVVDYGV